MRSVILTTVALMRCGGPGVGTALAVLGALPCILIIKGGVKTWNPYLTSSIFIIILYVGVFIGLVSWMILGSKRI